MSGSIPTQPIAGTRNCARNITVRNSKTYLYQGELLFFRTAAAVKNRVRRSSPVPTMPNTPTYKEKVISFSTSGTRAAAVRASAPMPYVPLPFMSHTELMYWYERS